MKNLKQKFLLVFTISIIFFSCTKQDAFYKPRQNPQPVKGAYTDGIFIIGEGSYGRNSGTINFYHYGADTISTRVYEKANPGSILSNAAMSSTLQFATLYRDKLYLLSKINGPIVKVDAATLKEEARYVQETSNWRSLLPLSSTSGLVSAADGVYMIDLRTLAVQYKLPSLSAKTSGEMLKSNDNIFVLHDNGTKVLSAGNYSLLKNYAGITRGFVQTPNGKVWGSTGSRLIAFDKNADTAGVALTVPVGSGIDYPTKLTASTKENAIFYNSGKNIYKYIDGQPASALQPFITVDIEPFMPYGVIRYDSKKDYIIVTGIAGYGAAAGKNFFLLYNATTGAMVKKIQYGNDGSVVNFNDIYFPSLTVSY